MNKQKIKKSKRVLNIRKLSDECETEIHNLLKADSGCFDLSLRPVTRMIIANIIFHKIAGK